MSDDLLATVDEHTDWPMTRTAVVSSDGRYRYALGRQWSAGRHLAWVGLNPSTADAERDDPTVGRMIRFSQREGYGGLLLVNLYAWRSTDPAGLQYADDPIGRGNPAALAQLAGMNVVCAWGATVPNGFRDSLPVRVGQVLASLHRSHARLWTLGPLPGQITEALTLIDRPAGVELTLALWMPLPCGHLGVAVNASSGPCPRVLQPPVGGRPVQAAHVHLMHAQDHVHQPDDLDQWLPDLASAALRALTVETDQRHMRAAAPYN